MSKTGTAEIVDFDQARIQAGGSNGGNDMFIDMRIGTVFCSAANGNNSSYIDEYMLGDKNGLTVLLLNRHSGKIERHIGYKFWKQNTMVQILHIPQKQEEENGNSA